MISYTDDQFERISEGIRNALSELRLNRKIVGPDYRLDLAIALLDDALRTVDAGDEQPPTIF